MWELLTESVSLANLPYTILMVLVFLYWVLYILGAVGSDVLDFLGLDLDLDADVDVDADVDIDADVDTDIDTGSAGHGSGLLSALRFFHVGEVPLMLIFSLLIICMWTISMLTTHYLGITSGWIALLLFFPILLGGLMITKALIMPFAPWLKRLFDQSGDKVEIVGKTCVVTSLEVTPKYGQAEFATDGAPILLNVKTREGETLHRGEEAVVYEHDKDANVYLIAKLDLNAKTDMED